ncbi:MAG: helix-turn-helix domain-containing protein [Acidimicrobiales bacterium]
MTVLTDEPVLRRDAAANRARILREAAKVFAERGAGVDVREIARAAAVGVGTLYRHFPTKEALLDAVIRDDVAEWAQAAQMVGTDDPWEDLRQFLQDALRRHAAHRALLDSFGAVLGDTANVRECRRRMRPVIEALVDRAQTAAVLRPDVTAVDIHLLLMALGRVVHLGPPAWQRQLDIALDGLRTPRPTALHTAAMTYDVLIAATKTDSV